jgi:arylformamidase
MRNSEGMVTDATFLTSKTKIIDISRPISSRTAVFPGDTPFSHKIEMAMPDDICNLSSFTMSPHLGTHADSPIHVHGKMCGENETAGQMPLDPFIGPALVVDLSPINGPIFLDLLKSVLPDVVPQRVLFKTAKEIHFDVYGGPAYIEAEVVEFLAERGVKLLGIDTPSVDRGDSVKLETHQKILQHGMYCLESLDLTGAESRIYFLVALPLKFMELESSPVRAILLASE